MLLTMNKALIFAMSASLYMMLIATLIGSADATWGKPCTKPGGGSVYGYDQCMALYNSPWQPIRLRFDYDPTFEGDSALVGPEISTWIKDNMLLPVKDKIESLLNVKRVQGPLDLEEAGYDLCEGKAWAKKWADTVNPTWSKTVFDDTDLVISV